jgi:alanyl-tRNA synthetase
MQALESLLSADRTVQDLCRTLSCRPDEVEAKVSDTVRALSEARSAASEAARKLALSEVRENVGEDGLCMLECAADADLQDYAQAVPDFQNLAMLATSTSDGRTRWLIALKGRFEKIDFNVKIRPIFSRINAKGGGRTPVFQGVAACDDNEKLNSFRDEFRNLVLSDHE